MTRGRYDAGYVMVSLADVRAAAERIQGFVVRTPLERCVDLSALCGVDVWLKFECFQATGSFKLRGALNALLVLPDQARQRGVITASAGNHGLGVARAASLVGVPATVVVPETASLAKVEALRHSGAQLILWGATYDHAELEGRRLAHERGLWFISAYNDPAVVAGGGTIALEVLDALPAVRTLLVPAGGGGLIGGVGVAAHGINPDIVVQGAQSVASPALHEALEAGTRVEVEVRPSLADGLSGNVEKDSITFDLLKRHVREVVLVEEGQITDAMRWLLAHEHVLVEGSGAVGVASLLAGTRPVAGPVAVVLSGRNVAASVLQQYVLG
ncbi:MAG: threonine/serine dehydratase [Chloroflexota bacterium]|nr:threonine/serine dehydratase [Chloroflexota bacterium]